MSGNGYAILAYAIGLGLMLLYGLRLWAQWRKLGAGRRSAGARA
ncbi:MAG: hypothetical protein ACF8R7_17935 [Phycisphaerales bacterium JB039]